MGSQSLKELLGSQWFPLVDATLSVEAYCNEIRAAVAKWHTDKRLDKKSRRKAVDELRRLVTWGQSVQRKFRDLFKKQRSGTHAAAVAEDFSSTCRRLQATGLKKTLETLVSKVEAIAMRLKSPYTQETRAAIDALMLSLAKDVQANSALAMNVRESLYRKLDSGSPAWGGPKVLSDLISAISKTLSVSTTTVSDTWTKQEYEILLKKRVDATRTLAVALKKARDHIDSLLGKRLPALLRTDPTDARSVEHYLDSVGVLASTAKAAAESTASLLDNATLGIDDAIADTARSLHKEIESIRHSVSTLDDMACRCRDIIARTPFKRQQPSGNILPFERFAPRQREILEVLIRHRAADSLEEFYAVTINTMKSELRSFSSKSTLDRDLEKLEKHEVVGKYQPAASAEEQNPSCGFWVEEYAYVKYGPGVLGEAWMPPKST